ncbi:MAG: hypothetical protein HQ510_10890 [Candidatus Marinimicrobia bacterium]|nr:hypothetical protein [Candidatus Neomarinimicrobiota bacterium]
MLIGSSTCKTSTTPQPADCNVGYHQCDYDNTICCMDTTSHDFVWEIDTLGIYGSYLNDVAIVDENNIWVVGNIETDEGEYNAAHWDGSEWELIGIMSNTLNLYSIFSFSENDIWVTDTSSPIHWDGNEWTLYHLQNMGIHVSVNHLWGTSSSDMYFVGLQGAIVHYDGTDFVQMESGTNVKLKDVNGTQDGEHVFTVGWDYSGESVALELDHSNWNIISSSNNFVPQNGNYGKIQTVDLISDTANFATRAGLVKYNYHTKVFSLQYSDLDYFSYFSFTESLSNSENDILLVGLWFAFLHYNGVGWYSDFTILNYYGDGNIYAKGADFKDNFAVVVGYCCGGGHAIVGRGYR